MHERFEFDHDHTIVAFSAKHLGFTTVRGSFRKFSGFLEGNREALVVNGEIKIEVASLTTDNEERDTHLRSSDFFDVEQYPFITFRLLRIVRGGNDNHYVATGDLTIKDTTRRVTLEVRVEGEMDHRTRTGSKIVSISADGQLNRMDYGVNWNGLAGAVPLAGHNIRIHIDSELVCTPVATESHAES